jgi:hypothetical protein
MKSKGLRWASSVARIWEIKYVHKILVGEPEGKRPLGRPERKWKKIKTNHTEISLEIMYCTHTALVKDRAAGFCEHDNESSRS